MEAEQSESSGGGEEIIQKWCSWCLQPAAMELVEKRFARRNLYQCLNCNRQLVPCTSCKCMARVHLDRDDRFCLRCDDPKPEEVVRETWCSWCVNHTMQRLQKASAFPGSRNYYHCGECGRGCVPCRTCSEASARGRDGSCDDSCLKCCGVVQDWHQSQGKETRLMAFGWCSWCFEKEEHTLEQASKLRRHTYTCNNCSGRTLPCTGCREGMARGGNRGWLTHSRQCAQCNGDFDSWEHNWQQRRLPRSNYMYD